jgi:hypothetical protein
MLRAGDRGGPVTAAQLRRVERDPDGAGRVRGGPATDEAERRREFDGLRRLQAEHAAVEQRRLVEVVDRFGE